MPCYRSTGAEQPLRESERANNSEKENTGMKKALALILALMLVFALSSAAFAADVPNEEKPVICSTVSLQTARLASWTWTR